MAVIITQKADCYLKAHLKQSSKLQVATIQQRHQNSLHSSQMKQLWTWSFTR